MSEKHGLRYDTPWKRLHVTLPLALLTGGGLLWALALFLVQPPRVHPQVVSVNAEFIEIPVPPVSPPQIDEPPVVKNAVSNQKPVQIHKTKVLSSRVQSDAPSMEPRNLGASPVSTNESSTQQPAPESAAKNLTPVTKHVANFKPAAAVGVLPPPATKSVVLEETEPNPMNRGAGLGGWVQEVAEPCEFDHLRLGNHWLWEQKCGHLPRFTQPGVPWCFDAVRTRGYWGSCDEKFERAVAAYKRKDFIEAHSIFKHLAEHEFAPAQSNLAAMYAEGIGVPQNDEIAAHWYKKAGADGDAKAAFNLALFYSEGRGVPKDFQQAFFWYKKASYYGYANAQYNLALMYASGTGVAKDDKQASYWFRKAADRGHVGAQYNLAAMYAEGSGVGRDHLQSAYWYCKSYSRGNAEAKMALLMLQPAERRAGSDDELAFLCWLVSSTKRVNWADASLGRREVERKLTTEQQANAQAIFQTWKAK